MGCHAQSRTFKGGINPYTKNYLMKAGKKVMKFKFNYSKKSPLSAKDAKNFSKGNYECQFLMQTMKGQPVAIFQNTDNGVWKVQHGFSTMFFGTYEEAMVFCRKRFCEIPDMKEGTIGNETY